MSHHAMCYGCFFWLPTGPGPGSSPSVIVGECHRHAPQRNDRQTRLVDWPRTRSRDWCGEHQPLDAEA